MSVRPGIVLLRTDIQEERGGYLQSLPQDTAEIGRTGSASETWSTVRSRPWSAGSRSGVDAQTGGGTGYGVANSGLRDGLRCGSGV